MKRFKWSENCSVCRASVHTAANNTSFYDATVEYDMMPQGTNAVRVWRHAAEQMELKLNEDLNTWKPYKHYNSVKIQNTAL